ncbi:MAG: complex I NDUFA9 subunit family protein [Xanthomonadales bacterium]|nr:complex I NDUFA9 subunit family protein [Xanthomonadales bacterium]
MAKVRNLKKICLVGGSGFVGEHLLNRWAGRYQLDVLSRNPDHHKDGRVVPGSRFHAVDVYDVNALKLRFDGAHAVVNLVGILNESGRNGKGFEKAHVTLTETALEAARKAGVKRFLQMSALRAGEGASHYLRTKAEAEQRVRSSRLRYTIFRPSTIFGPGDSFLNRFATLLRLAPLGLPLACPDAKMQPVYVKDVAAAFDAALEADAEANGIWELGGPRVYTLKELVCYVRDQIGMGQPIVGLPDAISRFQAFLFDYSPVKPFSSDNYRSLQVPSVTRDNALPKLGIEPTALEAIAPRYLGPGSKSDRLQRFRTRASR